MKESVLYFGFIWFIIFFLNIHFHPDNDPEAYNFTSMGITHIKRPGFMTAFFGSLICFMFPLNLILAYQDWKRNGRRRTAILIALYYATAMNFFLKK